ncbi:MAG TPA: 5-(carboxyamino)imidazole ribonucleotide synthase [Blastocatellia bacterium]|jgi:5-(carboxyamino)imidazole ribonucleotide synthase|nr:5-(carboxyamino)imidazole ribonucleotide synthase [Blastocatellia bacterium]
MIVGLLGGGQLGRMLALAGYPLGFDFRVLDHSSDAPAGRLAELVVADFDDREALARFASGLDVVTYEFENVPVETVRFLSESVEVYPPPEALEAAQDRLTEKRFFQKLGIPTPPFAPVDTRDDLDFALHRIGFPAILKTRRFGYDGKGQFVLRAEEDARRAWQALAGRALLLEGFVRFDREISILASRSRQGETAFYSPVENHHEKGMLRLSLAPAPNLTPSLKEQGEDYALRVLNALKYVGVLAVEFFELEGQLYANEMAPRVHNSGHWTIEGAEISQFENHLRAIAGLPLGRAETLGYSAMVNLIGELPDLASLASIPGAHIHLYGKAPRPDRKLGHVTLMARDPKSLGLRIGQIRGLSGLRPV